MSLWIRDKVLDKYPLPVDIINIIEDMLKCPSQYSYFQLGEKNMWYSIPRHILEITENTPNDTFAEAVFAGALVSKSSETQAVILFYRSKTLNINTIEFIMTVAARQLYSIKIESNFLSTPS